MNEIVVLTTADSHELAAGIANALVEAREAACVNIIPGVRSIYRWQGKICNDGEWLLLIKTTRERFPAACGTIRRIHTYQTPEILALPVLTGDVEYLRWLAGQVTDRPGQSGTSTGMEA